MAVNVPSDGDADDDTVVSTINTTPLVDVMLVLLIIFLITIPVVTHTVPVKLPTVANQASQTKPKDITIAINKDGDVFWDTTLMKDNADLLDRLHKAAVLVPQPAVHIRGDGAAQYQYVGKVVYDLQRSGIAKVGFITERPTNN